MKKPLLILSILFCCGLAQAQSSVTWPQQKKIDTGIIFRDTVENFVFDSLDHDLGIITFTGQFSITKHFKYTGKSGEVFIDRAWTHDPHFICEYPMRQPLVRNKIYSFRVCFAASKGRMTKSMGFYLSNGKMITLNFSGFYANDPGAPGRNDQ